MNRATWIKGPPAGDIEPDRLYAVLMQPQAGYSVGIVIRGEDCNWQPSTIAHYPLPFSMNSAEARRLQRIGWYDLPSSVRTQPVAFMALTAQVQAWLKEPKPDNGEPEPEEIAEARTIMENFLYFYDDPQITPDGEVWMTGAEVAARLDAEAKIITNYREQVDRQLRRIQELERNLTAHHEALLLAEGKATKAQELAEKCQRLYCTADALEVAKQEGYENGTQQTEAEKQRLQQEVGILTRQHNIMLRGLSRIGKAEIDPLQAATVANTILKEVDDTLPDPLQQEMDKLEARAKAAEEHCMNLETDNAILTELAHDTKSTTARQVKDLAMMVKLLCRKDPESGQAKKYMDYLRREGLQGSILREGEQPQEVTCEWSPWRPQAHPDQFPGIYTQACRAEGTDKLGYAHNTKKFCPHCGRPIKIKEEPTDGR